MEKVLGSSFCPIYTIAEFDTVVDSNDPNIIRFFYLRDGLPFYAIEPVPDYLQCYRNHMERPSSLSPHTRADARRWISELDAPKDNLQRSTRRLLYAAKAVGSACLVFNDFGGGVGGPIIKNKAQ